MASGQPAVDGEMGSSHRSRAWMEFLDMPTSVVMERVGRTREDSVLRAGGVSVIRSADRNFRSKLSAPDRLSSYAWRNRGYILVANMINVL